MHRIFVYERSSDCLTLSFVNSDYVCNSMLVFRGGATSQTAKSSTYGLDFAICNMCNVALHLDPGKLLGPSDPALRAPLEAPLRACSSEQSSSDQYPEFPRSALVYILVPLCS